MMNGRTIRRTAVMMVLLVGATGLATALPPVSVGLATAASTLEAVTPRI